MTYTVAKELKQDEMAAALAELRIHPSPAQLTQLAEFYKAVLERNKVMNLTAITEPEDFLRKHYVDCFTAYDKEIFETASYAMDIGTGGGFPGIPFAIYTPHIKWLLLDSVEKKLRFIEETAIAIGIKNVKILHRRAEDAGHERSYRERFDLVTARAVAPLRVLVEWALPFVAVGGMFIALKGPQGKMELAAAENAIETLGGETETIREIILPGTEERRIICYIRKTDATDKRYPRKPGTATKKPL